MVLQFKKAEEEPWAESQPGDIQSADEACVEYDVQENLWNDISCTSTGVGKHVLCQSLTSTPTESPTKSPAKSTTEFPIKSPIESPTKSPTEFPTQAPTEFPTMSPTEFPTQAPTESPTEGLSISPTKKLTNSPTEITLDSETSLEEESLKSLLNNFWTFLSIGFLLIFLFIVFFLVKDLLIIKNKTEKIKELKKKLERYSEDCSESI